MKRSVVESARLSSVAAVMLVAAGLSANAGAAAVAKKTAKSGDTSFQIGEEIVVTGSRLIDASRALTSVDRMAGDVAQSAEVDYAWELVGKLPGVMLTEFNQGATSGKLSFRGFNGEGEVNAVKLLIDGVPSNSNDGNMPFIDMIFPLEIEAVEVIRGTTDPRYGLHNIAGNVSFATRSGGDYVDSRLSAGSFGEYDGQLAVGVETDRLRQNYALGYRTADGYRDHSALDRAGIAGKWAFDLTDAVTVGASARHYEADAEEPGYLTRAVAYSDPEATNAYNRTDKDTREMSQFSLSLDASLSPTTQFHSLAWLNQLDDDRFVKFSANTSQQNRYTEEDHQGALAALTFEPVMSAVERLQLEVGASVEQQDNISRRYLTVERAPTSKTRDQEFDLTVVGVYGQAMIEPTTWLRITPAWRLDRVEGDFTNVLAGTSADINEYGTISQPKLSVALLPVDEVTLFANWGRTFQIGVGSGAYLIPPRLNDLEPSINEGWELGVKYLLSEAVELRVALWNQTATGEIKRKLNDPLGDFDNLGATERQGVDLQLSWSPLDGLSLWGAVAWQEATIDKPDPTSPALAGNDIDHIPDQLYSAGVDYAATDKLTFSGSLRAQSDYELTTANAQGKFGDFVMVDVEARYALSEQIELAAQVQNLTDEYYEYVWWDGVQTLHSPGEGRALIASVRLRY